MGAELNRIISKAAKDRKCKFTSLVHLVNEKNLKQSFERLKANKACGVDGMTKEVYGQGFDDRIIDPNLLKLIEGMLKASYSDCF